MTRWFVPALIAVMAGCAAPRETAVVTERAPRPLKPPSTEDAMRSVREAEPVPEAAGLDSVRARRFDGGKMWTFDNPPLDYFASAYGFRPDSAWLARARLSALRFATYCSASFVSPHGLVMTNHHCGRQSVTDVSKPGENLLDNGFYAGTVEDERKVDGLYVDQLIGIEDVTARVYVAAARGGDAEARWDAVRKQAEALEKSLTDVAKARDTTLYVQVIPLYHGGKYSAYTYHRYHDVRLVMAPELQIGFFGGDHDNFTFPRYNLDMSFFRVYGTDGKPLETPHHFAWSREGSREGDAVFVVGNPGSTSRLSTVSQLRYERDYALPQQRAVMQSRARILKEYIDSHPEEAETYDLRNPYFTIANSWKATEGQLQGLQDPYLLARRAAAERDLRAAIAANDSLQRRFGDVWNQIDQIQGSKRATSAQARALTFFMNGSMSSHVLIRAMYGYIHGLMQQRGFPPDQMQEVYDEAVKVKNWPADVEKAFIAARLEELKEYLGPADPTMKRLLAGRSPEAVAQALVDSSVLVDSSRFHALLDKNYLYSKDATVPVIQAIAPLYFTLSQQLENFEKQEEDLNARLARAQFAVYGTTIPPDASFSLRLADGVVRGYDYNGTHTSPFTTYYGLFDRYYGHHGHEEWDLPDYWMALPESFAYETPVNLASTNDIIGGNSGSPLVNKDLEIVGLVFDGNIESLPNKYLFTDERARTVSVDARGILEALDDVYDADRLVLEITAGRFVSTEEEADTVMSSRD